MRSNQNLRVFWKLMIFFFTHEKRKNVHHLTNGNKTAHAYRASLRTVFMDGMAPSAPEATGPSRREQPKDRAGCATKQPLPPAEPGGTHLPPKPRRRSSCFSCCQTSQKHAWSQQTNGLRPRRPRPPTWHGHARQLTRGKSFLSFAWHVPRTSRRWLQCPAERHHRAREGKPWWCPLPTGSPSTTISRRRPSSCTWAPKSMSRTARFVLTRPPASWQTRAATFSRTQPRRPKTPAFAHAARWWPRTSRGRPHRQERA